MRAAAARAADEPGGGEDCDLPFPGGLLQPPPPPLGAGLRGSRGIRAFLERGARGRSEARASPRPRGVFGGIEESIDRPGGRNGRPVSSRTPRGPSVDEFPAVVFHFISTKFFRLFRCKAEEFFGLIHYCRKELQWRA